MVQISQSPSLPPPPGQWRFGDVVLDERLATLRVGGEAVPLDRSGYDVLLALLRHAGEVVTKDELLEAGWPGRVVSENSLAKAVGRLRQALAGDGARIRVVHGYGYRLAAEVAFEAAGGAAAAPAAVGHLHPGDPLPHRPGWRLLRRLGEGRAGTTFLARSGTGEERAVKFARDEAGLRSLKREISLARYIRSIQAEPPDLAPLLDWNLSQSPFFVELPYFAHGHLGEWASAPDGLATLPRDARLAMCARLCEAVAGLHALGVIHRDLKPENLYPCPDADGGWRIVLADLGAGEAVHAPLLAGMGLSLGLGPQGAPPAAVAGSLLYLAPEVIAGELPTQRSDVFALGVLLYQLLCGDLRRSLAPGWEADIDDPLLREDIALAAAANPLRREIDAQGLAVRLRALEQRHAQRLAARRDAERAARRERELQHERGRRRLWLATAAAAGLGMVVMGGLYFYAEQARQAAERNARQRQALVAFVTEDILAQADPYRSAGGTAGMTVRQAVEAAAGSVDARFGRDPEAAAAVHELIGNVYFGQDRHAGAIAHYTRARDLLLDHDEPARRAGDLVRIEAGLCDVHRIARDLVQAEAACAAALAQARAGDPADRDFATLKLGQLRNEQGRYHESLSLLRPLLESPTLRADTRALGELYWTLGQSERGLADYVQARQHFEALLDLYRDAGEPGTWTSWAYNSLGSVLVETGRYAQAEPLLVEARRIFVRTQGEGVEAQMPNVWRTEARLRSGRWEEARELLLDMRAAWGATLAPAHPLRLRAEANLAWAEAMLGERDAANRRLETALGRRDQVFARNGDNIAARALRWLRVALAVGRPEVAGELLPVLEQAIERELPYPHPLRAEARCLRGEVLLALRRGHDDAVRSAHECQALAARQLPPGHPLLDEAAALLARMGAPASGDGGRDD